MTLFCWKCISPHSRDIVFTTTGPPHDGDRSLDLGGFAPGRCAVEPAAVKRGGHSPAATAGAAPLPPQPAATALPPQAAPAPLPPLGQNHEIVADVLIQGNVTVPTQQIKNQIKTRPGAEFSDATAQEDVRTLMLTKQFGNVEVVKQPAADGRVFVYFLIRDFPNLVQHIIYKGAKHPSNDDLDALHTIRVNTPLNPTANKLACLAIVRKYNEDGRPFAECHLLKGDKPGDTDVIFQITEGPKVTVKSISFMGNVFVSGGVLATHLDAMAPVLGLFGGGYNPQMVEHDIVNLQDYYKKFGFLDVRVSCERQWEPAGNEVNLIFHIQEGLRYTLKENPHIVNNHVYPTPELEKLLKMKADETYDKTKIDTDVKLIKDYYGYGGISAKVEPAVVFLPDTPGVVRVDYDINEQPIARVGQIFIVGNDRTQMHVIMRQLPFYPGQVLTYPELAQARAQPAAAQHLRQLAGRLDQADGGAGVEPGRPHQRVQGRDRHGQGGQHRQPDVRRRRQLGLGPDRQHRPRRTQLRHGPRLPTSFDDLLSGDAFRGAGQELRIEAVPGTELQRYTRQHSRAVPVRLAVQPDHRRLLLPARVQRGHSRPVTAAASA